MNNMTRALFAGSFDPFTIGHKAIVERVLRIADEVIVAIGVNISKQYSAPLDERKANIDKIFGDNPRVKVLTYEGLTTDFAKQVEATFLVRGVRSCADFETERDIARVNKQLTGIETVLLVADTQFESVSSSIVRELKSYGKDVSQFIP